MKTAIGMMVLGGLLLAGPLVGAAAAACVDVDGDGFDTCNPNQVGDLDGEVRDCDDGDASAWPGAVEVCDGVDDDCDGVIDEGFDADGDGWTTCAGDCDDGDAAVHPAVEMEWCNGIDDDCDGFVDEGYDPDGDGVSRCEGDCDNTDPKVHPGAEEICNGIDDDCDWSIDEGFDNDGDGWTTCNGDCADDDVLVHPGNVEYCNGFDDNCGGGIDEGHDLDGDGVTRCEGDCKDGDPKIHPGAEEICNGIDDDCDWVVDEGFDGDSDGWATCGGDCDDENPLAFPGSEEFCNGFDDDCDGDVDEGYDGDGDGVTWCAGDCHDGDPTKSPLLPELCNGVDDDCDYLIDEGFDEDGDGWTTCNGDCDDDSVLAHPGHDEEYCNGFDDDCDLALDEGCVACEPGLVPVSGSWSAAGGVLALGGWTLALEDDATLTWLEDGPAALGGTAAVVAGGPVGELWVVDLGLAYRGQGTTGEGPEGPHLELGSVSEAVTDGWQYFDVAAGSALARDDAPADVVDLWQPESGFAAQLGMGGAGDGSEPGAWAGVAWARPATGASGVGELLTGLAGVDYEQCAEPGPVVGEGDCCAPHASVGCEELEIQECVCGADPFCCEVEWDGLCVDEAADLCGACGPPPGGPCCEANGTPGCDDPETEECVCSADPYCCNTAWDNLCAGAAISLCEACGPPPGGPCCEDNGTPGCDDADVEGCVCAVDPYCCNTAWDGICVEEAIQICGACGPTPGEGACCEVNGTPGCEDPQVEGCVCALDAFCCEVDWDVLCVDQASKDCEACGGAGASDCCESNGTPGCDDLQVEGCTCALDAFCCDVTWDWVCVDVAMVECGACGLAE